MIKIANLPWSLTGVTTPLVLQSKEVGRALASILGAVTPFAKQD